MDFFLCSATFVICLAVQVSSQLPPKRIGEWHYDRYEMYPDPRVNASECRTPETSGLCDYNEIITVEQRKNLIEQPEIKTVNNADGCLCNKDCGAQPRIIVTVAIMKKIGPQISNYRAAAEEFAEKFRASWRLNDCSVILIASNGDDMCFLNAGSAVNDLLSAKMTEQIDLEINNNSCSRGLIVDGINATLIKYRRALEVAAQTTPPTPASTPAPTAESEAPGGSSAIIIIIIIVVLVVVIGIIVIIIIIIYIRSRQKARGGISTPKPLPNPHEGNATEKQPLESTPAAV